MSKAPLLIGLLFISGLAIALPNEEYFKGCAKKENLIGRYADLCSEFIEYKEADSTLSQTYKELLSSLAPLEEKENRERGHNGNIEYIKKLKTSQKAWLTYRNGACEYETEGFGKDSGEYVLSCLTEKTNERTILLNRYMKNLEEYPHK